MKNDPLNGNGNLILKISILPPTSQNLNLAIFECEFECPKS